MREIKFRGKRTANGEWVYGNLVTWHNKPAIQDYFKTNGEIFLVDPETVGQYTGIKDDNGKEIYEGDIIRIRESEFDDWEVYQVKYHGDMEKDLEIIKKYNLDNGIGEHSIEKPKEAKKHLGGIAHACSTKKTQEKASG